MAKKKGATNRVQQQKPKTKKYTTNGTESFDTEQDTCNFNSILFIIYHISISFQFLKTF